MNSIPITGVCHRSQIESEIDVLLLFCELFDIAKSVLVNNWQPARSSIPILSKQKIVFDVFQPLSNTLVNFFTTSRTTMVI